jgi:hypothetical protein
VRISITHACNGVHVAPQHLEPFWFSGALDRGLVRHWSGALFDVLSLPMCLRHHGPFMCPYWPGSGVAWRVSHVPEQSPIIVGMPQRVLWVCCSLSMVRGTRPCRPPCFVAACHARLHACQHKCCCVVSTASLGLWHKSCRSRRARSRRVCRQSGQRCCCMHACTPNPAAVSADGNGSTAHDTCIISAAAQVMFCVHVSAGLSGWAA